MLHVIDPAMRVAELDAFNHIAHLADRPLGYHLPALFGMSSLRRVKTADALIIFGSGASVHEAWPWQQELRSWLRPHLEAGVPTLGLCYGHQLIADMFGGVVDFISHDRDKIVGQREVKIDGSGFWPDASGPLIVSHRETVTCIPDTMRVFATSEAIPTDGLAHTSLPIWTLQSHPEATSEFLSNQDIPPPPSSRWQEFGHSLIKAFLDFLSTPHLANVTN